MRIDEAKLHDVLIEHYADWWRTESGTTCGVARYVLAKMAAEIERLQDEIASHKQLEKGMVDAGDLQRAELENERLHDEIAALIRDRDRLTLLVTNQAAAIDRMRRAIPVDQGSERWRRGWICPVCGSKNKPSQQVCLCSYCEVK